MERPYPKILKKITLAETLSQQRFQTELKHLFVIIFEDQFGILNF